MNESGKGVSEPWRDVSWRIPNEDEGQIKTKAKWRRSNTSWPVDGAQRPNLIVSSKGKSAQHFNEYHWSGALCISQCNSAHNGEKGRRLSGMFFSYSSTKQKTLTQVSCVNNRQPDKEVKCLPLIGLKAKLVLLVEKKNTVSECIITNTCHCLLAFVPFVLTDANKITIIKRNQWKS